MLVFACVSAVSFGLNGRLAQLAAWKGLDTAALAPAAVEEIVPATASGAQSVGLKMKPGAIDRHVDRADVQRDAFLDGRIRQRIARDRQLRGVRVDFDPSRA